MGKAQQTEAMELLVSGTQVLLQAEQHRSATELATYMVEHFVANKVDPGPAHVEAMNTLAAAFAEAGVDGGKALLSAALKWSQECGRKVHGEPAFHLLLARAARNTGQLEAACGHYLFAEQSDEFADVLLEWSVKGRRSERDLFLARACLRLLCLENLGDANRVYDRYMERFKETHAAGGGGGGGGDGAQQVKQLEESPLLHFVKFLMLTLERDAHKLMVLLQKKYAPSLQRDRAFALYLDQIALKFYNVKPRSANMGGIMGMVQQMMGGGMQ